MFISVNQNINPLGGLVFESLHFKKINYKLVPPIRFKEKPLGLWDNCVHCHAEGCYEIVYISEFYKLKGLF